MSTKSKAVKASKAQIKVADMKPKKDAKGGRFNPGRISRKKDDCQS